MTDSSKVIDPTTLPPLPLPNGIVSRFVDTSPTSLKFHILEAIPATSTNALPPLILLVHGFPNLAFDWRFILPQLASAGYHAVAFDQRGYGRTHNADLTPIDDSTFTPLNLIHDVVALTYALGHTSIHTLVGHDFGAVTASYCSVSRPDMVKSVVLMSHPFKGIPNPPYATSPASSLPKPQPLPSDPREKLKDPNIHDSMLKLDPPRKHYKWYYCTPPANDEMTNPTGQPLHTFLRGYFHLKSADNTSDLHPQPLKSWTADQLALLPYYYVMLAEHDMRNNIAQAMSVQPANITPESLSTTPWLPDADLQVYVQEWTRTTFRGGLNWYKTMTDPARTAELSFLAGSKIIVPMKFVSGVMDWGNYQEPGALEAMEEGRSVDKNAWRGKVLVEGAGHWVNMEKPDVCVREILSLAAETRGDLQ